MPSTVAPVQGTTTSPIRPAKLYNGRTASHPLHILIVGAGLGGLAAAHTLASSGHRVTLLEAAQQLGEVGAGIQVSPNVSRLLHRWGLEPQLKEIGVKPQAITFRRYATGEKIGWTRWGEKMEREFGVPYYHIHRADFHKLLLALAQSTGKVNIRLNASVVDVDAAAPSVTLASGEVVRGDVLVGADGVKSRIQQAVVGRATPAKPTGDAAYRAIIPAKVLWDDPELREFVENPEMTGWMAPGRHLMAYAIRAKTEYNLVLLHPDDGSVESWSAEGSADKMRADFADFEPRVQKMLKHVDSTLKWRLMDRQPLDTWVHPAGRTVLLGDACHPMLPYRAQGAAMAIEDAAVLGTLFSHLSSPAQIPALLRAYQDLRLARTAATQGSSRANQTIFHLPDGPEQERRDREMRAAMRLEVDELAKETAGGFDKAADGGGGDRLNEGNPNQWADKSKNKIQFGYDADEEAEKWWRSEGGKLEGPKARL